MTMDILEGLLLVNGTDVYTQYGAFLAETAEDKHENYDALLAPPALKEQTEVSIREENGVRLPDVLTQTFDARDIRLLFAIVAPDAATFLLRYADFVRFLKEGDGGWLTLYVTDLQLEFRTYVTTISEYSQLTGFSGQVTATFRVTLREPNPDFKLVQTPLEHH